jgi:aspartyl-tRNA(Asn)/glutamyl-tRNA(Gln) amidotransferase subunit A
MAETLHRVTIAQLGELISTRQVSPTELVRHFLDRIDAHDPSLNAFTTVTADEAVACARRLTEEAMRGAVRGPLHGIPVAIKDLTETAGVRTTYGSALFAAHVPAADATPVARLRAAGAVVVGKTNTHEFAFGTTTSNPHFGATQNPWRHGHVPGGSSGGSGAAVAAGLVPFATGSDTGGSIRIPSAACGCVGVKPSFGRVSLRGTYPLASTLDHVGPLARTVRDCAIALGALAGFDARDPWSVAYPEEDLLHGIGRPLAGLRVGTDPGYRPIALSTPIAAAVTRALDALAALGAEVIEVALPSAEAVTMATSIILLAESYAAHADQLRAHRAAYGEDVREQLDASARISATDLLRAQYDREHLSREVTNLLSDRVDVLLLPTMAVTAPRIGASVVEIAGASVPVAMAMASYTLLQNLTRMPSVAVPVGLDPDGLPTSVQLTARVGCDAIALQAAHALEEALWPQDRRWPGETASPL